MADCRIFLRWLKDSVYFSNTKPKQLLNKLRDRQRQSLDRCRLLCLCALMHHSRTRHKSSATAKGTHARTRTCTYTQPSHYKGACIQSGETALHSFCYRFCRLSQILDGNRQADMQMRTSSVTGQKFAVADETMNIQVCDLVIIVILFF